MKRKLLIQSGIAMAVFFALAFGIGVGQAYATTGCFTDTNGHWAETFICWMKDNGITTGIGGGNYGPEDNVTRAQMAVFMQKLDELAVSQASLADATNLTAAKAYADASDATNLAAAKAYADASDTANLTAAKDYTDSSLSTGDIYINAGLDDWVVNGGGSQYIQYYTNAVYLHAPAAGTYGYQITPDLPASLYGRLMYTHSVELCYDATHGASLVGVYFRHYAGGATPATYRVAVDTTARTDATCREYIFPSDGTLLGSDHVVLYIQGSFTGAADSIWIAATTFTLKPSPYTGVLSPEDATEVRPDMQEPQPASEGESGQ